MAEIANAKDKVQALTSEYKPKEGALYLTVAANKYGHLGKVISGSPAAKTFSVLGEILASGKSLDISVRPSQREAGALTIRVEVDEWKPIQSQDSTANFLRSKYLKS